MDIFELAKARILAGGKGSGGGGGGEFPADKYFEGGYAEIELPNATKIKANAFDNDTDIINISIPKVTSIGKGAFFNCTNLINVSMPKVTSIGEGAFSSCTNLALTSLPNGLTSIESYVFRHCTNLALTSLPNGLTSIGEGAFSYCELETITFEGTPTNLSSSAFKNCSDIRTINVPWAEGAVSGAPWGATRATINYNYKGE